MFVSKWVKNLLKSTHSKDFGTKWVENQHPILLVAFYYVLLTFFFFEENVLLTFEISNTNKLTNLMNENDNTIKK